jgi:hypothetical protein
MSDDEVELVLNEIIISNRELEELALFRNQASVANLQIAHLVHESSVFKKWEYYTLSRFLIEDFQVPKEKAGLIQLDFELDINQNFTSNQFKMKLFYSKEYLRKGYPNEETRQDHREKPFYYRNTYPLDEKRQLVIKIWLFAVFLEKQSSPYYRKGSIRVLEQNKLTQEPIRVRYQTLKWAEH